MLPIAKKEKPNMRKYDIMLEIRHRWKMLSDEEKIKYTKQYEKNMKEYRVLILLLIINHHHHSL